MFTREGTSVFRLKVPARGAFVVLVNEGSDVMVIANEELNIPKSISAANGEATHLNRKQNSLLFLLNIIAAAYSLAQKT